MVCRLPSPTFVVLSLGPFPPSRLHSPALERGWVVVSCSPPALVPCHPPTHPANLQDYFELGVILLRKKLFTQATRNLEKARKQWEGEPEELAQVGPVQSSIG